MELDLCKLCEFCAQQVMVIKKCYCQTLISATQHQNPKEFPVKFELQLQI